MKWSDGRTVMETVSMRKRVASYEELDVYRLALDLQHSIFVISKAWPKEEQYSLTDQIRRSSRSIGANISEAWAKRRYPAHFKSKLTDADGEQNETRHWLHTALVCGYLSDGQYANLEDSCKQIGAMLGRMLADGSSWTVGRSDGRTIG